MYICICSAITERDIHRAVAEGCRSADDLRRHLGVAAGWGTCLDSAMETLQSAMMPFTSSADLDYSLAYSA